jgi:hypothetical protein
MGLWMKCPKCQTHNPLFLKTCANCGSSLEHLPLKQRVYVLESASTAAVKPSRLLKDTPTPESPLPATTPEAAAAPKGAKTPKKPRKKKS